MTPPKAKVASLMASPDDIEAQFYEAMQGGDLDRLMAVWSDDDEIICVHPGGPRVVGAQAIRATFEAIFAQGSIPVMPEGVHRVRSAGSAVHNVLERVDIITAEGVRTAYVVATNVYVKTVQGWRLVAHHASNAMKAELPDTSGDISATLH
jgi:ketosteroid isomerase-like protein